MNAVRHLSNRFLALSSREQMKILMDLDLVSKQDLQKPKTELIMLFLARAKERNKLNEFWKVVESKYEDGLVTLQPF